MLVYLPGTRTIQHVCTISNYQMIIKSSKMLDDKKNEVVEANLEQFISLKQQ
jgi:hypothetical protein